MEVKDKIQNALEKRKYRICMCELGESLFCENSNLFIILLGFSGVYTCPLEVTHVSVTAPYVATSS